MSSFENLWALYLNTFDSPNLPWDEFLRQFKLYGGDRWNTRDIDGNISDYLWTSPTNRNKSICKRLLLQNARAVYTLSYPHMFMLALVRQYPSAKALKEACTDFESYRWEYGYFTPKEEESARIIQKAYRRKVERDCRPGGKQYYLAIERLNENRRKFSSF